MFVYPGEGVASVGCEEKGYVLGAGERSLMQQDAFKEFGEASCLTSGPSARVACHGEEVVACCAAETEALSPLSLAADVPAEQDEIAVVGDKHQAVGGQITSNLLGAQLNRQVGRNVVDLDHAASGRLRLGPFLGRVAAGDDEEAHVREARSPVTQVWNAKHMRLQPLPGGIQRAGEGAVIADLACAGARGPDAGDFPEVVGQNGRLHAYVIVGEESASQQIFGVDAPAGRAR